MSGCDLDGRRIRKGAVDAIATYVQEMGGTVGSRVEGITHGISDTGGTPLVVADGNKILGIIHLKDVGNMVDLDSNPTKLLEVVEIGKQMLMTRGVLTTFSIANDVAKYFAIIPAMFMGVYPEIAPLNIMHLASPQSAILSAVIFNAIIIILLIPLALRGVQYRPIGAGLLLARSLLIYGVGGVVAPFICIKLVDLVLEAVGLV